ncbi:MAG: ribonuclease H [Cyanophyceae cyanobacterium]
MTTSRPGSYTRINRRPTVRTTPTPRSTLGSPAVSIYTDGGCSPNPGPGGWGFVVVKADELVAEQWGGEPVSTNNRMELTALIRALKYYGEHLDPDPVEILSDSQLSVRIYNEWMAGWEARGWKRSQGPVENLDLVKQLAVLKQLCPQVQITWVKAHAGLKWNEYADQLVWKGRREL